MVARKRSTPAFRLFDFHPICSGIKAGAYARLRAALEQAVNAEKRHADFSEIRRCFREGDELLRWLLPTSDKDIHDKAVVDVVSAILNQPNLSPSIKAECIRLAPRRPRGRPSERKLRAVYALEAKLARPEATWEANRGPACVHAQSEAVTISTA